MDSTPGTLPAPDTPASAATPSALSGQVRALSDRAELTALCDRYVMHLDRDRYEDGWFADVFTQDAELTFPMGTYRGREGMARFQEMAGSTFERTHHLAGNYLVDIEGDQARVRAHLTAVHVRRRQDPQDHFAIGGHFEAGAVRTARGWRLRTFVFDLVWNAGAAPGNYEGGASR
ncbi:nuclear transport factor 2 family protein [Streptomyces boncukensis]|uniref:Nuclear transport factor 2 family protein n=1 Tax=Streptomyces boncukensis TaxID=2711219 RepID=A0A6G4WSG2_9ACTN|nr:nuclear transport factor 2 family protein [Streptomyces boncukensis]NGO67567.1 nuclear transport factor 2 family protein [Streptomyces boncukensis]